MKNFVVIIVTLVFGLCSALKSEGQSKQIDSLKHVIDLQKNDTNKIKNLYSLYWKLDPSGDNSKLQIQYGEEILALSKKLDFRSGQGKAYYLLSSAYKNIQDYAHSFSYTDSGIKILTAIKDETHLSWMLIRGANHYTLLGDTVSALNYYHQALKIGQRTKNDLITSQALNAIGDLFRNQGKFEDALQKHFEALEILKTPGFNDEEWGLAYAYQSIGTVFAKRGDTRVEKKDKQTSVVDYTKALAYYDTAMLLFSQKGNKGALAELNYQTGSLFLKSGYFLAAEKRFQESLKFYSQTDYKYLMEELYLAMSKLDSINMDYLSAYNHFKLYTNQKEKINIETIGKKIEISKLKSDLENKEYQIKLLATESNLNKQKKKFAYSGIAVLLFITWLGFYWLYRKRKLQNRQEILFERLRISKDLHDEVGATLSGIAMYSHLAKTNLSEKKPYEATASVDIIQHSATEMVTKLNDIIWLINPGKETLDDVVIKLKEYAQNMCMANNISLQFEAKGVTDSFQMSIETRKNIYLLCKEAINNASKYSKANNLVITFKLLENHLEVNIKDDGIGFDIATVKQGNGLENMQKRATDIGGKLQLTTSSGNGTHWRLTTKITHQGIV